MDNNVRKVGSILINNISNDWLFDLIKKLEKTMSLIQNMKVAVDKLDNRTDTSLNKENNYYISYTMQYKK